jgi:FkbM family methyltransferase
MEIMGHLKNIIKHLKMGMFCHYTILQFLTGFIALCVIQVANKFPKFYPMVKKCKNLYRKTYNLSLKKYIRINDGMRYYDFKGVKLIEIANCSFDHILAVHIFHKDNYDKDIVDRMEKYGCECPYCYKDGTFDVTVKENDIVIDAGASVGEFCAYTAYKKAKCYAFEPTARRYKALCQTAQLNSGYIIPIKKGLSDKCGEIEITLDLASPSFVLTEGGSKKEIIEVVTLDEYVEYSKLQRIDFIKADIEGAERNLLLGAGKVLKEFAPKLSLCTYHLPDDPVVLKKIIMDANPKYKIIQLRSKLMAMVMDE